MIDQNVFNRFIWLALASLILSSCQQVLVHDFRPEQKSSIVIIGNTFAEQLHKHNYFETLLYRSFPDSSLRVRNLGWSGDEVNLMPRPLNFGPLDDYLSREKADYIIACYGLNEAFDGKDSLAVFRKDLTTFLAHMQQQHYNGIAPPDIVLLSPIAHEDMGGLLPDPEEHNQNLSLYTDCMEDVARELDIAFVDLYDPTIRWMKKKTGNLTFNGIHLSDGGYRIVGEMLAARLGLPVTTYDEATMGSLNEVIFQKNKHYFYKYRAVNGEYIYGRRNKPFGLESFPPEFRKLDRMIGSLDSLIHVGSHSDGDVNLEKVGSIISDTIQYEPFDPLEYPDDEPDPDDFIVRDGYKIELFASEQDFPIGNATSFTFDPKGRLWVSTLESFPHYLPGSPPNDKLVILEDRDGDGRADHHTVFADSLYEPLGFELGDGGVYLSQPPNMVFLRDTNNDLKADIREPIMYGFGTGDVHHFISAYYWGPDGALYFHDGTFLHDQVETPYGPVRSSYGTTWRYEPYTRKLTKYVSYPYSNPWGNVFMRNGIHLISDASPGRNYYATPMTVAIDYPHKHMWMDDFPKTRLRPTCGIEVISSRHFPDEVQGHIVQPNIVGFQGIKQYAVSAKGSGIIAEEQEPLLQSKNLNFRPVDVQIGPDGALYILDFYNPIVGHTTFSFRDPNRDHVHGRIWRVTYTGKETLVPEDLTTLGVEDLLNRLKVYEDRVRYRTRVQLREFPKETVLEALGPWLDNLDSKNENYEQYRLEALWLYQQLHVVNLSLLVDLLDSPDPNVRASAVRVLYYWKDQIPDVQERLIEMIPDPSLRVRLEAIVGLSHFGSEASVRALLDALDEPVDYYIYYALNESFKHLRPVWMDMFRKDSDFLKNDRRKAYVMLSSVTSKASLAIPLFVKRDPEVDKYAIDPFDDEDFAQLDDVPAVVRFWNSQAEVDDSVKLRGYEFLASMEGKEQDVLIGEQIDFMRQMNQELQRLYDWKQLEKSERSVHNQSASVVEELNGDIEALTLFAQHQPSGPMTDNRTGVEINNLNDTMTIRISTLPGQMVYDPKAFTVVSGKPVKIVFYNPDHMQHNLLITEPGTMEKVGVLAEKMAAHPDAFEKNFIPSTRDVLFAIPLLDPGEEYTLRFTAPQKSGNYPFVCTFPGHWRTMNGIMRVVG